MLAEIDHCRGGIIFKEVQGVMHTVIITTQRITIYFFFIQKHIYNGHINKMKKTTTKIRKQSSGVKLLKHVRQN